MHLGNRTTKRAAGAHSAIKNILEQASGKLPAAFVSIDKWNRGMVRSVITVNEHVLLTLWCKRSGGY